MYKPLDVPKAQLPIAQTKKNLIPLIKGDFIKMLKYKKMP